MTNRLSSGIPASSSPGQSARASGEAPASIRSLDTTMFGCRTFLGQARAEERSALHCASHRACSSLGEYLEPGLAGLNSCAFSTWCARSSVSSGPSPRSVCLRLRYRAMAECPLRSSQENLGKKIKIE